MVNMLNVIENSQFKIESLGIQELDVYDIEVDSNHNFFANNVLVHNRFCFVAGTQITLEGGSKKNIEDIVIGDEVLSFNETSNFIESKKVIELKQPMHSDLIKYHLSTACKLNQYLSIA